MKIKWKKFFSWYENFYYEMKWFSMIPHPKNNVFLPVNLMIVNNHNNEKN